MEMVILALLAWGIAGEAALGGELWTLERCLGQALAHNPDAQLARHRIAVSEAGLEQANAVVWPHLQFQSSYSSTDNPMQSFGSILNQRAFSSSLNFNDVPEVDDLNTRGVVTVPLYAGGRIRSARAAAKASAEAAREDEAAVRNALGFEVVRAFHTVHKTGQFILAAEAAVAAFDTNAAIARKRMEDGVLLKTDVLDMEVRLAQAREDLVHARNAHALAQRALCNVMGIEGGELTLADTAPAVPVPSSADFSHRPELRAARERESAAEQQLRGAKSGYLPQVSAFGSLDYDYGYRFDHDGASYTAGALLQWNLWDGSLTRAKVREAAAQLDSAREEQRKLRLALDFETEKARLELRGANERLNVTGQSVAQAAESATLTRARFQQGLVLGTQLIEVETALIGARVRLAEAQADQRIAVGALRKALALPQIDSQPQAQ